MRDWTVQARDALANKKQVAIQVRGNSMTGRIEDGDMVTLAPCSSDEIHVSDAVLVTISGKRHVITVLHLVHAMDNGKFLIGNNQGRLDGWVGFDAVHGKAIDVSAHPSPPEAGGIRPEVERGIMREI